MAIINFEEGVSEAFIKGIHATELEGKPRSPRHRPRRIPKQELFSTRDHLFEFLDRTWVMVDENLSRIETLKITADEIPNAFKTWADEPNELYVVKLLLRSISSQAKAEIESWIGSRNTRNKLVQFHTRQKEIDALDREIKELADRRLKFEEHQREVESMPESELSKEERKNLKRKIGELLKGASISEEANRSTYRAMKKLLEDARADFARSELVRFCESPRYATTPRNVANALAGLPFIGWRQSTNTCIKSRAAVGGPNYRILRTIKGLVELGHEQAHLLENARNLNKKIPPSKVNAVSELWQNLRCLTLAIQRCAGLSRDELPYGIAREYLRIRGTPPTRKEKLIDEVNEFKNSTNESEKSLK